MKAINFFALLISIAAIYYMIACNSGKNKKELEVTTNNSGIYTSNGVAYQPFPTGYGYLQDTTQLSKAVTNKDIAYVRSHAWSLWAGIMQQADSISWPLWYTWPTTKQAFAIELLAQEKISKASMGNIISRSLISFSKTHIADTIFDNLKLPVYKINPEVSKRYPTVVQGDTNITVGKHFLFNQDIMIPTESLSIQGFNWIRKNNLYKASTLDSLHKAGVHEISAPQAHIVTKHMFWPILANTVCALPVWADNYDSAYTGYAGYEQWRTLVAVDPTNTKVGLVERVTYLYGVLQPDGKTPYKPVSKLVKVHGINEFYYHRVSQTDWDNFDESDKAIINASSYWAYNRPFGPGDYLITVAMHVNTKEIPTWALQSVWWSESPTKGKYAANRPYLPSAKGPWEHYDMVDGYGITYNGNNTLPVGMNPYIELVIHPIATNCNNCHIRSGWPEGQTGDSASYQNRSFPNCINLLGKLNTNSDCLQKVTLTDFQWLIPDHVVRNK